MQCTEEEKGAELEGQLGLVYNVVCVLSDTKLRVSSSVEYE